MKTFEVFKNGTQQGELFAKNLKEAKNIVFATYGEHREVYELEDDDDFEIHEDDAMGFLTGDFTEEDRNEFKK